MKCECGNFACVNNCSHYTECWQCVHKRKEWMEAQDPQRTEGKGSTGGQPSEEEENEEEEGELNQKMNKTTPRRHRD